MKRASKEFYNKNKDKLVDIILLGSVLKNKISPNDIDLTLITKTDKNSSLELSKKFELLLKNQNFHITYHLIDDLFSKEEPIWQSIFREGYSLIFDKPTSSSIKLIPKIMFSYKLATLQYKDKIRFYYALKGRDGKSGIVHETGSEQVAKGVLLTDVRFEQEWVDFFMNWKIPFKQKKIFVS